MTRQTGIASLTALMKENASNPDGSWGTWETVAKAIYDAGWRKTEADIRDPGTLEMDLGEPQTIGNFDIDRDGPPL